MNEFTIFQQLAFILLPIIWTAIVFYCGISRGKQIQGLDFELEYGNDLRRLRRQDEIKEIENELEMCAGCGLMKKHKDIKFRGLWNEPICSEECKEIYNDYLDEISEPGTFQIRI